MTFLDRLLLGLLGGLSATGPMTAVMLALHRRIPQPEKYPLPPREITAGVLQLSELPPRLGPALTLLAHFGFGATAGAAYGLVNPSPDRAWLAKGLGFGFLVWAAAYGLLLPSVRVLRPATEQPAPRNGLMIVAHFVWGAVLSAFVASAWRDQESRGLLVPSGKAHQDRSA